MRQAFDLRQFLIGMSVTYAHPHTGLLFSKSRTTTSLRPHPFQEAQDNHLFATQRIQFTWLKAQYVIHVCGLITLLPALRLLHDQESSCVRNLRAVG